MHRYHTSFQPWTNPKSIISSNDACYRITVLTEGLLRLEWSPDNKFEDRASTFATCRNLSTPTYRLADHGCKGLEVTTSRFRLTYDKKPFSANGLSVQVLGNMTNYDSIWRYGSKVVDLGGTARTLDEVNGRTQLGSAVISRRGYALIDDSDSMLFTSDGWVAARKANMSVDIYVFAYGHDYQGAVRALYSISGSQPLLPRWCLGNWWSRFYAYTEQEYLELMDEFKRRNVPLSVAVVDMDWHLVKQEVCQKAGVSGWTGYTWDKSLFPDPSRFGREIHKRGLMLTLNDHPADGIHSYEEPYQLLARELGQDTSAGEPISFDITDRKFSDAFFDILHRRIENDSGCDFWWIDWQQGSVSKIPGIDPLWMLNHFHFLDNTRPGRHPLTFSRFAGPGGHRYPIGFSGDSIVSWESLAFQPEFTNCASNIGYGWWSHDIGGHMNGKKDDELQTRWVQYGVFSPIMRLHSTANPWNTKEPWNFRPGHCAIQSKFLRWRHRLVPYVQTMNVLSAQDGLPLCQPMYWSHPEVDGAYKVPNQYMFGSSLVVVPITTPRNHVTKLSTTKAWLPPGKYIDIFTRTIYEGGRSLWLHRPLEEIPVLAPVGAILPLDGSEVLQNGCQIPDNLDIVVFPGSDTTFNLLEEQLDQYGVASIERISRTTLTYSHVDGEMTIEPPTSVVGLPQKRNWTIRFQACSSPSKTTVTIDGNAINCTPIFAEHEFIVRIKDLSIGAKIKITFSETLKLRTPSLLGRCAKILSAAQTEYSLKEEIWHALTIGTSRLSQASQLDAIDMENDLRGALLEQIFASEMFDEYGFQNQGDQAV